jgi:hypothetical protein
LVEGGGVNCLLAVFSQLGENFVEQLTMRGVKPLMIARHILTWLWLLLWIAASPVAQARMTCAADAPAACVCTTCEENQPAQEFVDHFCAFHAARRLEVAPAPADSLDAVRSVQSRFVRPENISSPRRGSEILSDLACGWQFALRTALSPRAPSSVS